MHLSGLNQASVLILWTAAWVAQISASAIPRPRLVKRQESSLYFPVEEATLRNARREEEYEAYVGGLVIGPNNATATFKKVGGDDWVEVSSDGNLSGTPDGSSTDTAHVEIVATDDEESSAKIQFSIPVHNAHDDLVNTLGIMNYNLWLGGTQVHNYHEKQLRFILSTDVDIIGMEEAASGSGDHTIRLGKALGWSYWQSNKSVGIISRYPIVEEYGERDGGGGVRISLNGASAEKRELNMWTAHPNAYPYGPYNFCFDHLSPDAVLTNETASNRTPQITELVGLMRSQIEDSESTPVVLVGDMNSPSHLDWIPALREKNCGIASFPWPVSVVPTEAGLIDSFRVVHPDPVADQGTTWSPLYPLHNGTSGDPEPQDRIDFVYSTKELRVLDSEKLVVGHPKPYGEHEDNEWTSDHAAVLTHFALPRKGGRWTDSS